MSHVQLLITLNRFHFCGHHIWSYALRQESYASISVLRSSSALSCCGYCAGGGDEQALYYLFEFAQEVQTANQPKFIPPITSLRHIGTSLWKNSLKALSQTSKSLA
jgi:hypothetical protein